MKGTLTFYTTEELVQKQWVTITKLKIMIIILILLIVMLVIKLIIDNYKKK